MIVPTGFVDQAQLADAVEKAVARLGPEVIRVRHSIGADASGEPAIFFRIVLTDQSVAEDRLAALTGKITTTLFNELRPYENWGLFPYFSFRAESEQITSPDWV
jgi:hypothetical protein